MIKDFFNSISEYVKERTDNPFNEKNRTPFFGAFFIYLIYFNWQLVYTLFNFDDNATRIEKIKTIECYLCCANWFDNLLKPVLFALASIILFYLLNNISLGITTFSESWIKPTILKLIDKNKIVTKEEKIKLEEKLISISNNLENLKKTYSDSQSEIDSLNKENSKNLEVISEIEKLKNSQHAEYESRIRSYNDLIRGFNDFKILFSIYGVDVNGKDVSSVVSELLKKSTRFLVSNENFGYDPAPNFEKQLLIVYTVNSSIHHLITSEGHEILNNGGILEPLETDETRKISENYFNKIKGNWMLNYKRGREEGSENVIINKEGECFIDGEKQFIFSKVTFNASALVLDKFRIDESLHAREFLIVVNENLVKGFDSLGFELTYRRVLGS